MSATRIPPPTAEQIATAYEFGGCDRCFAPPDTWANHQLFSSEPNPGILNQNPNLIRLEYIDWAGCFRCRTQWSLGVSVTYVRDSRDIPPYQPSPLDTWSHVAGDGVPPFVRAAQGAEGLIASVGGPTPVQIEVTPEEIAEIQARRAGKVTFYRPPVNES